MFRLEPVLVSVLCLLVGSCSYGADCPDLAVSGSDRHGDLKMEEGERARLGTAIELLSDSEDGKWLAVESFDAAFGSDFAARSKHLGKGEVTWGVIDFREQGPLPPPGYVAGHSGWFLAVQFDSFGNVRQYHLTNKAK